MTAAVLHGREDVRIESVEVPRPGPGEVLLRIRAALTCGTDVKVYRRGYHARMIVPPALFGHEVAGTVEEVGAGVAGFAHGQAVVAANSAPCGACEYCRRGRESLCDDLLFWNGAYAQFALVPARIVARNLLPVPPGCDLTHAAMVEPLACVLRAVEEAAIGPGQSVAVKGTGPIALMFVVLARRRGARVVSAGRRPDRLERAEALGAETVRAPEGEGLAELLRAAGRDGRGHDVVVEAAGTGPTSEAAVRAARKGGVVNLFGGCPAGTVIGVDAARLHYEEIAVRSTFHHTPASVREALRLVASGQVDAAAFLTARAPLAELPDVLRRMAEGGEGLKTVIFPWDE
jgi:L-iditol 2-dehydrogenase